MWYGRTLSKLKVAIDGHFDDQQTTHHIGLNIFDMIFLALTYFGHVVKKEIQIVC